MKRKEQERERERRKRRKNVWHWCYWNCRRNEIEAWKTNPILRVTCVPKWSKHFFLSPYPENITLSELSYGMAMAETMNFPDLYLSNGLVFSHYHFLPSNLTKSMKKSMKQSSFSDRRNQFRHNSVEESCISCNESIWTVSIELYALTFHRTTLHWLCSLVVFPCSLVVLTLKLVADLPISTRRANAYQIFCRRWTYMGKPLEVAQTHTHTQYTKIPPPVVLMFVHKYSI